MKAWIRDAWGAVSFRSAVYRGLRNRPDAFFQGFIIVLAVALFASLPTFIGDLVATARSSEPGETQVQADLDQLLQDLGPWFDRMGVPPGVREQMLTMFEENLQFGLRAGAQIEALPTALPKPVGRVFAALGRWFSRPFANSGFPLAAAALGTWLGYGIWVMLAAKLLGGRGTLQGFFGATALFALPHVLDVFRPVPFLGPVLAFVAFVWGFAIYIKATAESHEMSFERALLASILPLLIAIMLVILVVSGVIGILALSALGSR